MGRSVIAVLFRQPQIAPELRNALRFGQEALREAFRAAASNLW